MVWALAVSCRRWSGGGYLVVAGIKDGRRSALRLYGSGGPRRWPVVDTARPVALAFIAIHGGVGRLHRTRRRHGAYGGARRIGNRPVHVFRHVPLAPAGGVWRGGGRGVRLWCAHRRCIVRG